MDSFIQLLKNLLVKINHINLSNIEIADKAPADWYDQSEDTEWESYLE